MKKKRYTLLCDDNTGYYIQDNEGEYKDEGNFNWMTKDTILDVLNKQDKLIKQLKQENMIQTTKLMDIFWKYNYLLNDDCKKELKEKLGVDIV